MFYYSFFAFACSALETLVDCVGCKPWHPVSPTRTMKLERFYTDLTHFSDYLTPLRLFDLCRATKEGMTVALYTVFNSTVTYNITVSHKCHNYTFEHLGLKSTSFN